MRWEKLGLIFETNATHTWAQTHAQVPTVDVISDKVWRIYYSARNSENQSHISYFDVEAGNPRNVLYRHNKPILRLGALGTFDDAGMMPSSIVSVGGIKYMYYTGWTLKKTTPYLNSIGLAVSHDEGKSYTRVGEGPVIGISLHEPYFIGTATVLLEEGLWRNWYAACTGWEIIDGRTEPRYHLKYAESNDGIEWRRKGQVAIDFKNADEGGLVRAAVLKSHGRYLMWYSRRNIMGYRSDSRYSYRIGYAESCDGVNWTRMDSLAGIDISATGWDSEMIAYPSMAQYEDKIFLFYNGNGFGQSGIGVAQRSSI